MSEEKKLFCFRLTLAAEGEDVDSAFVELLDALRASGPGVLYSRSVEEVSWRMCEPGELINKPIEPDDESIDELLAMANWSGKTTETKA